MQMDVEMNGEFMEIVSFFKLLCGCFRRRCVLTTLA